MPHDLVTGVREWLRPPWRHPVVHVDDDPHGELLPMPHITDPELDALDAGDAEPIVMSDPRDLFEILRELEPAPAAPLGAPYQLGFRRAVELLADVEDPGFVADKRVRRVLDVLGDRGSITVGPDGITVYGLLRRRHTPWDKVKSLTFGNRYELLKAGALERWADDVAGAVGLPIPGLRWVVARLIGGIGRWLEQRLLEDDAVERLREQSGLALTDVDRRGFDIELSGLPLVVSLLGIGLNDAILGEARLRGVAVVTPRLRHSP